MQKTPKPLSTKRPPEPSDDHAEIDAWMRNLIPTLQPVVERIDAAFRETIPGLRFAVKWKQAFYGLPELGWLAQLAAYDVSANVVFFGGADFDPPPPLGTT